MPVLTDLKARNIKPGGPPISDGTVKGLRLEPGSTKGHGRWIYRFMSPVASRRRDMGLGSYPKIGLAEARRAAADAREVMLSGDDPIEVRKAERAARKAENQALTFEAAARRVHVDLQPGWANAKHADQWLSSMERHIFPKIGRHKVKDIRAGDFADALRATWVAKPETASRLKQRCNAVMDWCVAQELVGANPVSSVSKLLPKQPSKRERVRHFPAMPWRDVPDFVRDVLRTDDDCLSKRILEFLILTAARSGEVRAMTWDEVDLEKALWVVPAERMKAKVVHRVPLSARAVEILKAQKQEARHETLVFPSLRGRVPSDMILTQFLRARNAPSGEPGRTATAHGFRSSFRDWASENGYARDLAERALSHTVRDQTEAAYHRTDLLEQRRAMMDAWADYVGGKGQDRGEVIPLRKRA